MNFIYNISLNFLFLLSNSADPDEMPLYVAFQLGIHSLPKYPLRYFQETMVLRFRTFANNKRNNK